MSTYPKFEEVDENGGVVTQRRRELDSVMMNLGNGVNSKQRGLTKMEEKSSVTRKKSIITRKLGDASKNLGRAGGTGNDSYDDDIEETVGVEEFHEVGSGSNRMIFGVDEIIFRSNNMTSTRGPCGIKEMNERSR